MSFAHRIQIRTPLGYNGYWFKFKDQTYQSYSAIIDLVLERYARRFGKIYNEEAEQMQWRLACKYSSAPHVTARHARSRQDCGFVYPCALSWEENEKVMRLDMFKDSLRESYKRPAGDYCPMQQRYESCCNSCGIRTNVSIFDAARTSQYEANDTVYLNGWVVCKDRRCRAIATMFKKGYAAIGVERILMEVIKNAGQNDARKRLKKHFVCNTR